MHGNTCTFDTSVTQSVDIIQRKGVQTSTHSDKVVLMVGTLARVSKIIAYDSFHKESIRTTIKRCKPNIMVSPSYKHHGSSGDYYAFGNKTNYGLIDDSSVGIFTIINSKNKNKQIKIN